MSDADDRAIDSLDRMIRSQKHRCFIEHRHRSDLIRMHPADHDILRHADSYWFYYAEPGNGRLRFMGMQLIEDESCVDGPVVECPAYWEHGRKAPRGYVASEARAL